jgi:hypothetical protein
MPIDFELSEGSKLSQRHYHAIAKEQMRPISRRYDLREHQLPTEWVDYWWNEGRHGRRIDLASPTTASSRYAYRPKNSAGAMPAST